MAGCARSSRVRATVSWPRSPARPTRWRVRWGCSARRWRRSGCASACTPARCSCATTGNYIGPTINRTARLRDLAHGGQTVISGATEELVIDRLPADAWLTDLGTHPLRDLPRPERVVQLCHPDLCNEFPPLRTPSTVVSHNLPVQLTNFVGRGAQMTDVEKLLADNRLVTLTGAGGAGKTRLALRSRLALRLSSMTVCGTSIWRRSPIRAWYR